MTKNTFIAISSDKRELYKADIYKILSKPKGAIEHFRYRRSWIQNDPHCIDDKFLIGQSIIIIFKHVEDQKPSVYLPIRKATIIDFFYDTETEVYHYYFQLENFCKVISKVSYDENIFFQKDQSLKYQDDTWKNIIETIKLYFSDNFFYKIDGVVDRNGKTLELKYDKINHSYYYTFYHGKSYTLDLSVANPNSSSQTLAIESSSTDINIVLTKKYFISAPYDKLQIPITTKSLDSFKEKSFLSFYINDKEDKLVKEFENHIHISKRMNYWKPTGFGTLSSILIACTWLLKDKTSSIENMFSWKDKLDILAAAYTLMIFICSSLLFALFNKK